MLSMIRSAACLTAVAIVLAVAPAVLAQTQVPGNTIPTGGSPDATAVQNSPAGVDGGTGPARGVTEGQPFESDDDNAALGWVLVALALAVGTAAAVFLVRRAQTRSTPVRT